MLADAIARGPAGTKTECSPGLLDAVAADVGVMVVWSAGWARWSVRLAGVFMPAMPAGIARPLTGSGKAVGGSGFVEAVGGRVGVLALL
jgi:hypothetical protein